MIGSEENEMLLQHLRDHLRSKAAVHLTIMFVTAAITIPLAVLSFAFYERPFLRMKRFFD
jgi:peptidoglycan/LPS O-acetylase OafA/YrhL